MSIIRTRDRSVNVRTSGYRLRKSGFVRPWPTTRPFYVGAGSTASTTTTANVSWPGAITTGDLGVLVVQSSDSDADAVAAGWAHFPGSPVIDVASTLGSKLNILYKYAESPTAAAAALTDAGDHQVARIVAFRNVRTDAVWATATDTKTVASTTVTYPSINTLSPNNRLIYVASRPDDSSATTVFSSFTNANLTEISEVGESGTTLGNGGGFVINLGTKASLGATGTSTATMTTSLTNAVFVLALEPSVALAA